MNLDFLNDLTLVCCDGELPVIAHVWCLASEVFTAMLSNAMMEKGQRIIKVEQFELAIVAKIYELLRSPASVESINKIDEKQTINSVKFCHLYQLKQVLPLFIKRLQNLPLTTEIIELDQQLNLIGPCRLLSKFFTDDSLPIFTSVYIYYELYKMAFESEDEVFSYSLVIVPKTALQAQEVSAIPKVPLPPLPKGAIPAIPKLPLTIPINPIEVFGMNNAVAKVTDSLIKSTVTDLCPQQFYNIVGYPVPDVVVHRYLVRAFNENSIFSFLEKHNNIRILHLATKNKDRNFESGFKDQFNKLKQETAEYREKRKNDNAKRARSDS